MDDCNELEVVKVSPSAALDRALMKEKKKKKKKQSRQQQQQQQQQHSLTQSQQDPEAESQGQELLWVEEDDVTNSNDTTSPHNTTAPHKKKGFLLGKLRSTSTSTTKNKKETSTTRVVLLPTPTAATTTTTTPSTPLQQATLKAKQARELLDQAVQVDSQQTHEEREEILKQAICAAKEARRLVDPQQDPTEQATEQQTIRDATLAISSSNDKQDTAAFCFSPKKKKTDESPYDHAEQARRCLESMLPDFLDEAVSEDDESQQLVPPEDQQQQQKTKDTAESKKEEKHVDKTHVPDRKQRAVEQEDSKQRTDEQEQEQDEDVRQRAAAEKHATISRVVQQNNTMSTLGFDNTYMNADTLLTINSLNAFLDGEGTVENTSPTMMITATDEKDTKTKKSKFALFGKHKNKKGAVAVAAVAAAASNDVKVDRFQPTILPAGGEELEVPDPDNTRMVQIQNINRVTGSRLEAAMYDDASVASWDGVPKHNDAYGSEPHHGNNMPRDNTKMQPQFVAAPKLPPGLMNQKSWEDLVDGASLADVASLPDEKIIDELPSPERVAESPKQRFGLFGRKKKKSSAVCSAEPSTNTTKSQPAAEDPPDDLPNNVSLLSESSSFRLTDGGVPDRYTAAVADDEDFGHDEAQKRNDRNPSDVDLLMPHKPVAVDGIRQVFSWDDKQHTIAVAKPSYVEVMDDGEGDEAKVVLANKEQVVTAIEASRRMEPPAAIKITSSMTNDLVKPTDSFLEEMHESKDKNAAARSNKKVGKKKGLLVGFWKTPAANV